MTAFLKKILVCLLAVGSMVSANAFSLNGPTAPWQTTRLGYDVNPGYLASFGVMNIGEEYRWNVPKVYYAFTSDFLNFFGQRGVEEVEKAIQIMNDLPRATDMRLEDYPVRSARMNHRAEALLLTDLRSYTLSLLVQQAGLTAPSRYVYTLRTRWIGAGGAPTNYYVIKRNFDPVTLGNSSYINGRLWTYTSIIDEAAPGASLIVNEPVDPLDLDGVVHSPVANNLGADGISIGGLPIGGFWTGLTRDDIGGLKYIYRNLNRNVENAPPTAIGGTGAPWGSPFITNSLVEPALRGGVEKVTYIRANYDSLVGGFVTPFFDNYSETIYIGGLSQVQAMQRTMITPNLLFDAADVTGGDGEDTIPLSIITFAPWDNNNDINGSQVGGSPNIGPGVIPAEDDQETFVITYNTVGPVLWNIWPFFLDEISATRLPTVWGSFDGTTNDPVVYPNNVSLEQLESLLLQAEGQ